MLLQERAADRRGKDTGRRPKKLDSPGHTRNANSAYTDLHCSTRRHDRRLGRSLDKSHIAKPYAFLEFQKNLDAVYICVPFQHPIDQEPGRHRQQNLWTRPPGLLQEKVE